MAASAVKARGAAMSLSGNALLQFEAARYQISLIADAS